jgi:hypothetical protein
MDASADYEPVPGPQNQAGGFTLPTLEEYLAGERLRVKIVVETEHGNEVMTQYLPQYVRWGQTVDIKATLEARIS